MPTRIVELMIIVLQATANMFIYLVFFVFLARILRSSRRETFFQ